MHHQPRGDAVTGNRNSGKPVRAADAGAHVFEGSLTFTRRTAAAGRQAGARYLELIVEVRIRPGQPGFSPDQAQDR
jgi:hypothetical protein